MLLSSNGEILGNDNAVHFLKAREILDKGEVSAHEISWYPPLYRVVLAVYLLFTGSTSVEHFILLLKGTAIIIDLIIVFSAYLLGKKILNEGCGFLAASLAMLSYSLYEINFWAGYPNMLALAYLYLMFHYLVERDFSSKATTFITAFSVVLTHHFTTFVTLLILFVFALVSFLKFREKMGSVFIAAVGFATAFTLWYAPQIIPNLNLAIRHLFFEEKSYLYLVKYVTFNRLMLNFGFILPFSILGAFLSFYIAKKGSSLSFLSLLYVTLFLPILMSQIYVFGIMLPYDRFIYFLIPPTAVFSAVTLYLLIDAAESEVLRSIKNSKFSFKAALLSALIFITLLSRFPILLGKISEATGVYSYLDSNAHETCLWLKNVQTENGGVVVTEKPGMWAEIILEKPVVMEFNPVVEWPTVAETVLNFAYEIENPTTLFRVHEVNVHRELDQYDVLVHRVWKRVAFLYSDETTITYSKDHVDFKVKLSELPRSIKWDSTSGQRKLQIQYCHGNEFVVTETVNVKERHYPVDVKWTVKVLDNNIENLIFQLSYHFDLHFKFEKVYLPGIIHWENPWVKPTYVDKYGKWAVLDFVPGNLTKDYVGIYDDKNGILFSIQFDERPNWASVGVLNTSQVDALRFQYKYPQANATVDFSYSILAFSEESYRQTDLAELKSVFEDEHEQETLYRDYLSYTKELNVRFLIYDLERFNWEFLKTNVIQQIYINEKYVVCKLKNTLF